jgi:hypothetical protein
MPTRATSTFNVTGWDESTYHEPDGGPRLSRAIVKKSFQGDMAGESTAELLGCQADEKDLTAGAGYVASELFTGSLGGKSGSFVIQHVGLVGHGSPLTSGNVVPGSGRGELAGLTGTMEISVAEDGTHTLTLDYDLE